MSDTKQASRPLSPHLQIYRPMLSMMMSITHRITGIGLYAGSLLVVWWFSAASSSDACFEAVQAFFGSWFGRLLMFGFSWALIHHALGGIRHFIWDTGRGFKLGTVETLVKLNIAGSVVLTLLLWVIAYGVKP